jgi:hypothetical protein
VRRRASHRDGSPAGRNHDRPSARHSGGEL